MGYAKYVGRVGALAVALGVGAAVASCPGIAFAAPTNPGSETNDPTSTPPAGSTTPADATPSLGTTAVRTIGLTNPLSSPTARTGSSALPSIGSNAFTSTSLFASPTSKTATTSAGSTVTNDPGSGIVSSTGGAQNVPVASGIKVFSLSPSTSTVPTAPSAGLPTDLTALPIGGRTGPATTGGPGGSPTAAPSATGAVLQVPSTQLSAQQVVTSPQSAVPAVTSPPISQPSLQLGLIGVTAPAQASSVQAQPVTSLSSTPPSNTASAAASPSPGLAGLGALVGAVPGAPAGDSPALLAMLAYGRKESEQTAAGDPAMSGAAATPTGATTTSQSLANNTAPTATPSQTTPNQATGAISGSVNGSDIDPNTTLTYTVTGTPANGSVTVDRLTGAFTYTPTEAARLAAGQTAPADFDSFTVSVSDGQAATPVTISVAVLPSAVSSPTSTTVGTNPTGVAVSPTKTYVVNQANNTVSVIDRANPSSPPVTINVVSSPTSVAVSADSKRVYVAGNGGVSVIDTSTNKVIRTVSTGSGQLNGIAVSPDGQRVYATNAATNRVVVINHGRWEPVGDHDCGGHAADGAGRVQGRHPAVCGERQQQQRVGDQHQQQHRGQDHHGRGHAADRGRGVTRRVAGLRQQLGVQHGGGDQPDSDHPGGGDDRGGPAAARAGDQPRRQSSFTPPTATTRCR